jgi:hypothetical protein
MSSDNSNTATIVILAIALVIFLFYVFGNGPIHNDGKLKTKNNKNNVSERGSFKMETVEDNDSDINSDNNSDVDSDANSSSESNNDAEIAFEHSGITSSNANARKMSKTFEHSHDQSENVDRDHALNDDSVDSSMEVIWERASGLNNRFRDRIEPGKYKHNSYRSVGKNNSLKSIEKNFKVPDLTKNHTDRFVPLDESDGQGAPIDVGANKGNEKDKYNVDSFLPQEKEKDWFETIETVDVKNSHLINIYRPIGANSIGNTHKNATYDLRGTGTAVCPKFVVSPWLQSSYEQDRSLNSLC